MKVLKGEKKSIIKESNSISVALKARKKDLEHSLEDFEKETKLYKMEIEKLTKFKVERDAERKDIKGQRRKADKD